jgi:hypothetical protein
LNLVFWSFEFVSSFLIRKQQTRLRRSFPALCAVRFAI